jgi:predicted O-linked N-acetylglucosamine transferase (SPINDLY family)
MTLQERLEAGVAHHQAGRLAEAETLYREVLVQQPDHADALHLLGMLAGQVGELDVAVDLMRRATELNPNFADAHNNLGFALAKNGKTQEAIASYREAVRLKPDLYEAQVNLANVLDETGKYDESIAAYREAIRVKPDSAESYSNLGNVLRNKRQLDEAIASYREAIRLKPYLGTAYNNLANALVEVGEVKEAIATFRQALLPNPEYTVAHSNLILLMHYQPDYDAGMIREELQRWDRQHAEPLKKLIQPHANNRDSERRLRIGYVSPDFREHVVGRNLIPLFREHDHARFEIFCYANVARPDWLSEQFRSCSEGWRGISGVSDERAAEMIREDRIDILVDLAVHSGSNRLLIFARKPAPVQATFAGYPGSTGMETIDYRITDPYLDPPGTSDAFYSEKSIRLPDSFWVYDAGNSIEVNPLPAETRGHVTFGCLNNFCKVNEPVLKLWIEVLGNVDQSRLIMLCPEGKHRKPLLEFMQSEGINHDRIELIAHRPRSQYFKLFNRIDIGLDTFPYNGHTTSLDSFWMGVPVISLVGQRVVGRAGVSQLTNLGLKELIAWTPEEFVKIAKSLADDLPRLAELRRTLRGRMQGSALMNASRFARNIEAAYRDMWRKWCGTEI